MASAEANNHSEHWRNFWPVETCFNSKSVAALMWKKPENFEA